MNPFVNPNKRDFLLPKGCKDLTDLLKRYKWPTEADVGNADKSPTGLTIDLESTTNTIAFLEGHLARFVESTGSSRSLTVITPKEHSSITFFVAEPQILIYLSALVGDEEAKVREFFAKHCLNPMHEQTSFTEASLVPVPGAKSYQIFYYLLPRDIKEIARIARELLQELHGVDERTELHFVHYDPD